MNRNYAKTKINWIDFSWNPWIGCTKVSAGCKFCYMLSIEIKAGRDPRIVRRTCPMTWNKPLYISEPSKIFTCSMSDFFHEEADEWRDEAWEIIKKTPRHQYLILTKRPERIKDCLPKNLSPEFYSHVWLGGTVENDDPKVINRIKLLQEVPCKIRFISFEPLLEDIKLEPSQLKDIHWGIIGGESGKFKDGTIPLFREAKPEWFRNLVNILKEADVAVWFKQAGTYLAHKYDMKGKGDKLDQIPPDLRIREFPKKWDINNAKDN